MISFLKPLYRVWYTVDHWLSMVPNESIQKFDTALFLISSAIFVAFLQFLDNPSINIDRINGIIIILVITFLTKKWWFSDKGKKESVKDQKVFEITPEDFFALAHFTSLLLGFMAAISFLIFTGEFWLSLMLGGILATRTDSIGPSDDDMSWKITVEENEVLFHGKKRTARLRLDNVAQMKVFLAFNQPKKIIFEMEDGQIHQIKYYRKQDEILKHCMKTVPETKIEWLSYT